MIAAGPIARGPIAGPALSASAGPVVIDRTALSWMLHIQVGGVDVTAQAVGEVFIEAEEDCARIAEFSLLPPVGTTLYLPEWSGRSVGIAIADFSTGMPIDPVVLFVGEIDLTHYNHTDGTIQFRCSDGRGKAIAALSRAQIDALVLGYWSPAVFNEAAIGVAYAKDVLSTVPASLDMSIDGQLRVTSWVAKTVPDLSFGPDRVLDGSLTTDLAERSVLTNTVVIEFGYRFPRIKAEGYFCNWRYVGGPAPQIQFAQFVDANYSFLTRAAVASAIEAAGGTVIGDITYDALPTNPVIINGGAAWLPSEASAAACMGFEAVVGFDYAQTWDENHTITVTHPASVAAVGTIDRTMSGALEANYQEPESAETRVVAWRLGQSKLPPADIATVQSGKTVALTPSHVSEDTNRAAANKAIETLIAIAKTTIWASHRKNSVNWSVPLNVGLDTSLTVAIDCAGVTAKGKVRKFVHRLNPATAEAISEISLAICALSGVGVDHPEDATTYAEASPDAVTDLTVTPIVTYDYTAGANVTIEFPGVEDVEREKATVAIATEVRATFVEDLFTVVKV